MSEPTGKNDDHLLMLDVIKYARMCGEAEGRAWVLSFYLRALVDALPNSMRHSPLVFDIEAVLNQFNQEDTDDNRKRN